MIDQSVNRCDFGQTMKTFTGSKGLKKTGKAGDLTRSAFRSRNTAFGIDDNQLDKYVC